MHVAQPPVEHAGSFIEHADLTQLSAMLKAIDAGDRIVKARLELYSCSRRLFTKKQQDDMQRDAPELWADSPFGPMSTEAAQNLLINLKALMSLLFVDYDCSGLSPRDFLSCPDKHGVVNTINHSLALVVDRVHAGFLREFWQGVQDSIDVVNCEIYAFKPSSGSFGPTDNSLVSFHYFFVDRSRMRILFIGSVTKSRGSLRGCDSESDLTLSQDGSSGTSKAPDTSSSMQESDCACVSDSSGDDAMFD